MVDTMSAHHIKVTDSLVILHTPVAACPFSHSFQDISFLATCHISYDVVYTAHVSAHLACFHSTFYSNQQERKDLFTKL